MLIETLQLDIMLFMAGMCGILAVMTMITKILPFKTKLILVAMEISAMVLLLFDRFAYVYRGDSTELGYYMVRISNATVYLMLIWIPFLVNRFLVNLFINASTIKKSPRQLFIADVLFCAGFVLVIVAIFSGLFYTIDENNVYHRGAFHALCYIIPFINVILQEWTIIQYRKTIKSWLTRSLIISIALPTIASILQIIFYGLSLTNMTTALVMMIFYTYSLGYISETAENARKHELEFYKKAKEKESEMFGETTSALANAIDAKDKYTRGHSSRVALYAKKIALKIGLDASAADEVYFGALLHDVGKIGVKIDIINKPGKLSTDEFSQIKAHPLLGYQILSGIKEAPYLCEAARSHHERYDGTGYPDGLKGENIPLIARIVAVADAYDAMTSQRSYREPLERSEVRKELIQGTGTQFDPAISEAMLILMDEEDSQTVSE